MTRRLSSMKDPAAEVDGFDADQVGVIEDMAGQEVGAIEHERGGKASEGARFEQATRRNTGSARRGLPVWQRLECAFRRGRCRARRRAVRAGAGTTGRTVNRAGRRARAPAAAPTTSAKCRPSPSTNFGSAGGSGWRAQARLSSRRTKSWIAPRTRRGCGAAKVGRVLIEKTLNGIVQRRFLADLLDRSAARIDVIGAAFRPDARAENSVDPARSSRRSARRWDRSHPVANWRTKGIDRAVDIGQEHELWLEIVAVGIEGRVDDEEAREMDGLELLEEVARLLPEQSPVGAAGRPRAGRGSAR